MAVPKNFKINTELTNINSGFNRRQEILDWVSGKETFLPRGVDYEDIDREFLNYIKDEINFQIKGEKVPVIFLTLQRWSEFNKFWGVSDEYKDIKLPFITIIREPNPQNGTQQGGMKNIPGKRYYTYYKVPTIVGGKRGVDLYQIPQPTSVDFLYKVTLFTTKMKDLNSFNERIQLLYNSLQKYIFPKGHPMASKLESISDQSEIQDFENRRFFVQEFEILLLGYVLNERDFIVKQTVRNISVNNIIDNTSLEQNNLIRSENNENIYLEFIFNPLTSLFFEFVSDFTARIDLIYNAINLTNIKISINGILIFDGLDMSNNTFIINNNDVILIEVVKINNNLTSNFKMNGNIDF